MEFDGKIWKQVATDGPRKRAVHTVAYDKHRKVTVLFGGKAGNDRDYLSDTWHWDGKVWKQMTPPVSPSPRFFHLMVYDEVLKAVVLLAGGQGREAVNDAWEWTGDNWRKLGTPPAPMPTAEAFVYDPQENDLMQHCAMSTVFISAKLAAGCLKSRKFNFPLSITGCALRGGRA